MSSAREATPVLRHMRQLDGLRALAVGGVMVGHFAWAIGPDFNAFVSRFAPGTYGVHLFFVLSGFLITGILLRCRDVVESGAQGRVRTFRQFYIRRSLRIFPVYYLTLAATAAYGIADVRHTFWWHLTYLSNVYTWLQGRFFGVTAHFWSLAVEEQFYLAWPWLVLCLRRRVSLGFIIAVLAAAPFIRAFVIPSGDGTSPAVMPWHVIDFLLMGALLAYCRFSAATVGRTARLFPRACWLVALPVWLVLATLRWYGWHVPGQHSPVGTTIEALMFVGIVDRAAHGFGSVLGAALQWRPMAYVGKVSYAIYLFHAFVPFFIEQICRRLHVTYPYPDYPLLAFVLFIVATIAAASVSWHLLERPMNDLKRHFPYKPASTPAPQAIPEPAPAD